MVNLTAAEQHELLRKKLYADALVAGINAGIKHFVYDADSALKHFDNTFPMPTEK